MTFPSWSTSLLCLLQGTTWCSAPSGWPRSVGSCGSSSPVPSRSSTMAALYAGRVCPRRVPWTRARHWPPALRRPARLSWTSCSPASSTSSLSHVVCPPARPRPQHRPEAGCAGRRRYPAAHKDELERQCSAMIELGIVRRSDSAFSSPVILVKKADDTWRFCVDYRALNALTYVTRILQEGDVSVSDTRRIHGYGYSDTPF